jgi:hypothetical protein
VAAGNRIAAAAAVVAGAVFAQSQGYLPDLPLDHAAIQYSAAATDDPVARLMKKGAAVPDLPALLDALKISTDSQMLVFSKTSFQAERISPRNPRAVYFTDDAAVAWIRGAASMEVAAVDPRQGAIFYSFDSAGFHRQGVCLHCHSGAATQGVPGMFIGSVFPAASGAPSRDGAIITDHRTAFADRWGGWYVTARRGEERDRANGVAPDPFEPQTLRTRQNIVSLAPMVDLAGYLAPTSDIVALMTFEHQTQAANLLTRVGWDARIGTNVDADLDTLVRYLLFQDETPLREPVEGVSSFTESFSKRGPYDRHGRSLREFDLNTRLFRYPVSFMIYSAQFDALPESIRDRVYRRILEHLKNRPEALAILRDTKPNLPAWFKEGI